MSTPDDPTRRMPPPDPRGPVTREREVIADDTAWRAHVGDQLRTIRGALFGVGLVALLGLALGVYLLATRDDDDDGGASRRDVVSRSEARDLDERLDKLEAQVGNRAGESDVDEIQESQSQINGRLDALEQQAGEQDTEDTEPLEQAIQDLSGDVQELSERVDEVEQEQQRQP